MIVFIVQSMSCLLVFISLIHSISDFKHTFCNTSLTGVMIEKVLQTEQTSYLIRHTIAYPLALKPMDSSFIDLPLIEGSMWTQDADGIPIPKLFNGKDYNLSE